MKKLISLAACLICMLSPLPMAAQQEYQIPESTPANNGELDWLVFKDRNGEAKINKKDIVLKSNVKSMYTPTINIIQPVMTCAKIPVDYNGDFYVSATMKPSKVDDTHMFGLEFGNASESDYNAILFDDQFCYVVRVYKLMNLTQIQGLENRVRYKYQKAKDGMWTISFERKNGGDFVFSLNGLEVMTYPGNTPFSFASVGACVTNKGEVKITEVAYEQWAYPADSE
ncbi:MAG: hypothetical protein NC241_08430 [Bacteroides sp.]|nr:hypothetical protein [Bacteroides sp.]